MVCLKKLSPLGAGLAALGLWAMTVNAGNTANNLPGIINFYGPAPQTLTLPFPGLHADLPFSDDPTTSTNDFVNGSQNVAAYFYGKAGGNAGLDTTASTGQPTVRYLYLDLSSPVSTVSGTPDPFPGMPTGGTGHTVTVHISQNLLHPDTTGTLVCCGGTTGFGLTTITPSNLLSDPQYGEMAVFWPDPANKNLQWKLQWGPAGINALDSCLQTSVDSTGTVWKVNTFGYPSGTPPTNLPPPCSTGPNPSDHDVAALFFAPTKGSVTWTLKGYYNVPFSFTIKKQ